MSDRRWRAGAPSRGLAGGLATVLLSSVGAYLALELWRANLSVPFRYSQLDDTKFYLSLVKGILEHGWYQHNANLGAPFGAALYDFPQGADNLNFLLIKAIGLFSSDYAVVTNVFFLLTFPLTGLAAYGALRRLGIGAATATVCSVLFALLPYHFYRHESQVLLSAYYAVPIGAYLFLSLFGEDPLVARRDGGPRILAWMSRRTLGSLVACVVIGSAGLYYAVFAILLLLIGTLVALAGGRGRRTVLGGAMVCGAITVTVLCNLSPSLLYTARNGANAGIVRTALESEQLGLRLSNLVLPVRGHRLPFLAGVNLQYAAQTSPGYCESCNETLGLVGATGFTVLCLIGLVACVGVAATPPAGRRLAWQAPYRPAALGVAIGLAIGTTGALSGLIAFLLTPDVRGWNRISLFIAFFSLLAAGLLIEGAGRRLRRGGRRRGRGLAGALLVAVLVLGGLDETSTFFVVDYAGSAREYKSDMAFGQVMQSHLPPGASVLELPYVPFPEGYHVPGQPPPTAFATSYELMRPYLSTTGLRWSFGAIKGRPTDWMQALAAKHLDVVVAAGAAAGFTAIYVNPRGYSPGRAAQVRAGLTRLLGVGPLISPRGDAWLFDLRPYRRRAGRTTSPGALAAAGQATLHPLLTACGPTPANVFLINPGRTARRASFSAAVSAPLATGVTLVIGYPDGVRQREVLSPTPVTVQRRLAVAPGRSVVSFTVAGNLPSGASPTNLPFLVSVPTLTDQAFDPFALHPAQAQAALPVAGLLGPTCDELYADSAASKLPSAYPAKRGRPHRPRPAAF